MPTFNTTVNLTGAQTNWQAVKAGVAALPSKVQAVQATIGLITIAGQPGPGGTVTFVADVTQTQAALADLKATAAGLVDAIGALQAILADLPVTVTAT
ncbi:MAG TPA: hypothetical protein VGJ95_08885, partial [Pseudonocardiaceae bacterium]